MFQIEYSLHLSKRCFPNYFMRGKFQPRKLLMQPQTKTKYKPRTTASGSYVLVSKAISPCNRVLNFQITAVFLLCFININLCS